MSEIVIVAKAMISLCPVGPACSCGTVGETYKTAIPLRVHLGTHLSYVSTLDVALLCQIVHLGLPVG